VIAIHEEHLKTGGIPLIAQPLLELVASSASNLPAVIAAIIIGQRAALVAKKTALSAVAWFLMNGIYAPSTSSLGRHLHDVFSMHGVPSRLTS
jgi:hypothetical protein